MTHRPQRQCNFSRLAQGLATLVLVTACAPGDTPDSRATIDGTAFATYYRVTLPGVDDTRMLDALRAEIDALLDDIDASMSTYRADSELNRLNEAPPGEWQHISGPLFDTLVVALQAADDTDGAFDVTVGRLVNLWGFGPDGRPERVPDPDALARALADTGPEHIELDAERQAARRLTQAYIDLSGVAKGYAVDAVAALLDDRGFESFLASIGGDMVARGQPAPGRAWRIGIEAPEPPGARPVHALALRDRAIATSGDYRNYFEHEGRRYSHIIDPRTGHPVDHRLGSVSVIHADNIWANAYATGLFALGPDAGMAVADRLDLEALFVVRGDDGFEIRKSRALELSDTVRRE